MRTLTLVLAAASAALSIPAFPQAPAQNRADLDAMRRQQALAQQRDTEARIQRARDRCVANRGADCDTMEGLQEWLLLDRSRADAVLDRISPLQGSASTGGSAIPGSTVPDLSPYNVGSGR
ncbi:MAG: hypothetical protein JO035_09005 [Betaproteobacteria bacterium]|nr:hypothetical protein [Betaproteobacteria bacterium]